MLVKTNSAVKLLRLIRDGQVTNRKNFAPPLKPEDEQLNSSYELQHYREMHLYEVRHYLLDSLIQTGLVYETQYGDLSVTPLYTTIQKTLGLSLRELELSQDSDSIRVVPRFGQANKGDNFTEIFVIMPFSEELSPLYDVHIREVASKMQTSISRGDDFFNTNSISQDIWSAIFNAKVLIADCTGRNPNVFYEIGIAHAIGKPTILISQRIDDIPFDLRHIRTIIYECTQNGMLEFKHALSQTLLQALGEPNIQGGNGVRQTLVFNKSEHLSASALAIAAT
jgi:hypothetical protein